MKKSASGFTIVELLIVIVVIAILATISVVAYNGVQLRAKNTARVAAGEQWVRAFQLYAAQKGSMPPTLESAAGGAKYCLGTGFPAGGGGVPRCQNVNGTDTNSPAESDNTTLMSELQSVTQLPSATPIRSTTGNPLTGPWVYKRSSSSLEIYTVLDGTWSVGVECSGGFISYWTGSGVTSCMKTVNF